MTINQNDYDIQIVCNRGCAVFKGNSPKIIDEFMKKEIGEKLESYFEEYKEIVLIGKFKGFESFLQKIKRIGYKIEKTNLYDKKYLDYNMILAVIIR
jgi:hypothetical protein